MTTMTDMEKRVASLVEQLEGALGEDGITSIKEKVKAVAEEIDALKAIDINSVIQSVDKVKAEQEVILRSIRHSQKGLYVPGIEDTGKDFSFVRAMLAVKTGNWKNAGFEKEVFDAVREKAAQSIGDDAAGGYFVPDQTIPDVIAAIYTASAYIGLEGTGTTRVSVLDGLTGANVKVPKFEGGLVAYWIGEEDEYAESMASVGDVTMNPSKLGVLARLTDSMRRMGGFGFEGLFRRDMIRAAAKKVDWTIPFGSGTEDMPRGITHMPGIKYFRAETGDVYSDLASAQAVADWDGGKLEFEKLSEMMLALEEDDIVLDASAAMVSGPRYWNWLKNLRNTVVNTQEEEGKSFLLGAPLLSDAALADYIGPFGKTTQHRVGIPGHEVPGLATDSTAQKYMTVVGGNLGEILVGRWGGIEIEDDGGRGKGFTSDHTYMKLRMYMDIQVRQERAIIVCPDAQVKD